MAEPGCAHPIARTSTRTTPLGWLGRGRGAAENPRAGQTARIYSMGTPAGSRRSQNTVAQQRAQFWVDALFVFDGQVTDAALGIELIGRNKGLRGQACKQAQLPQRLATGWSMAKRNVGVKSRPRKITACVLVDDERILPASLGLFGGHGFSSTGALSTKARASWYWGAASLMRLASSARRLRIILW